MEFAEILGHYFVFHNFKELFTEVLVDAEGLKGDKQFPMHKKSSLLCNKFCKSSVRRCYDVKEQ